MLESAVLESAVLESAVLESGVLTLESGVLTLESGVLTLESGVLLEAGVDEELPPPQAVRVKAIAAVIAKAAKIFFMCLFSFCQRRSLRGIVLTVERFHLPIASIARQL